MDKNKVINFKNFDSDSPQLQEVSEYSADYPIKLFSDNMKRQLSNADEAIEAIYRTLSKSSPIIAQVYESTKKGFRYVVDASEGTINAIENGQIKLSNGSKGQLFAQIREANGQYGKKLPIKKEIFAKRLDPVELANTLQLKSLQDQIQQISDQVAVIDQSVREVIQGQQNDRIGLYYSGLTMYLESIKVNNSEFKKALLSQALRALTDARFQLGLEMQLNIKYLANSGFKIGKGRRVELIDDHIQSIDEAFRFIHQATMLRAGIYCQEGEYSAMTAVLSEYALFINNTISCNAGLLAQCDRRDNGTNGGTWQSRAKLKLEVTELAKNISMSEKEIYLGLVKED